MNCFKMFVRVIESFLKSVTKAVLMKVSMLASLKALAANVAHQVLSDSLCGTLRKAIALMLFSISL